MQKFSWRKNSFDSTLIFIPVDDIHKHVSNVVLRGYLQKYSSIQDVEGEIFYAHQGWKAEVIKYEIFGNTGNESCGDYEST